MRVEPVAWDHPDAEALRVAQTEEIGALYASEESVRHRAGSEVIDPDAVAATFVAYDNGTAVGHIGLRWLGGELEIKRMYIPPAHRGSGIADELLAAVESAAYALGAGRLILHTGNRQHAAISFYQRRGYTPIPVYWPYEAVTYSLCFEKVLSG